MARHKIKIGIPYALYFYQYFPLWKEFLTRLGAEVILSKATNKEILDAGIRSSLSEVCLPVKIFYGHVLSLKDQVDYLLIPRMVCVEKGAYFCPKIIGLPDMVKSSIHSLCPLLNPTIDVRQSSLSWRNTFFKIGRLITDNSAEISHSFMLSWHHFQQDYLRGLWDNPARISSLPERQKNASSLSEGNGNQTDRIQIAVLGHNYLVDDPYVNLDIVQKLKKMNVNILTTEMIGMKTIKRQLKKLYKPVYWSLSRRVVGAAFYYFEQQIEGMIHLSSFECGEDSMVGELIHHQSQYHPDVAYTEFVFDEHTGAAGINTRLEAFLDMIRRKKRYENSFAPSR